MARFLRKMSTNQVIYCFSAMPLFGSGCIVTVIEGYVKSILFFRIRISKAMELLASSL